MKKTQLHSLTFQIQIHHKNQVLASAEGGLDTEYNNNNNNADTTNDTGNSGTSEKDSSASNSVTSTTTTTSTTSTTTTSTSDEDDEVEDWSPVVYANTDVQLDQLLYLCVTTFTQDCHKGGRYRCLFSYTLEVEGARPITVTQLQVVSVPVEGQRLLTCRWVRRQGGGGRGGGGEARESSFQWPLNAPT